LGNLDHIQRSNADKESCQNCLNNHIKFSELPCSLCKGNTDMFCLDESEPPVCTGKDIGL